MDKVNWVSITSRNSNFGVDLRDYFLVLPMRIVVEANIVIAPLMILLAVLTPTLW